MNIKDHFTGAALLPQHMIATQLYTTWNKEGEEYKKALSEFERNWVIDYRESLTKEQTFIKICELKAEELWQEWR